MAGIKKVIPSDKINLGTVQFTDTALSAGSPLVIDQTPVQLTNNKGGVLTLGAPAISSNWVDLTGKFTPDNGNGDTYMLRLNFTVDPNQNNRTVTIELDIGTGGSPIIIHTDSRRLSADAATVKQLSFPIQHYTLGTFLANGGRILVKIDGNSTADVYGVTYVLTKLYKV